MSYRFVLYKIDDAAFSKKEQVVYVKQVKWRQLHYTSSPEAAQRMCWCMAYFISLFQGCLHVQMVRVDSHS
jgi:hypothetical protein